MFTIIAIVLPLSCSAYRPAAGTASALFSFNIYRLTAAASQRQGQADSYLPFGGLLPRPLPEGCPGFLLGPLGGAGFAYIKTPLCSRLRPVRCAEWRVTKSLVQVHADYDPLRRLSQVSRPNSTTVCAA
jgi:hypothetical protein